MGKQEKLGPNDQCPICGEKIKHCQGHPRKSRKLIWVIPVGLLVLFGSAIVFFKTSKDNPALITDSLAVETDLAVAPGESVATNLKFFDEYFLPIIESIGDLDKIPPPLRNRYQIVGVMLNREYGTPFQLTFGRIHNHSRYGRHALAKSIFKNGRPYIEIFIPTLRELCEYLQKSGAENWREQFQVCLYITVLHEMEHFAAHHIETKNNPEVELEEEIDVWGKVAEYAFLPVRKYDPSLLTANDNVVLDKWLECGQRSGSDLWRKFFKDNIGFGR